MRKVLCLKYIVLAVILHLCGQAADKKNEDDLASHICKRSSHVATKIHLNRAKEKVDPCPQVGFLLKLFCLYT